MPKYNPSMEGRSERQHHQPNGVSEDPRNQGWNHRTQIEQVDSKKRQSISQRVDRRRNGKTHNSIDPEQTRHEFEQEQRPKSGNHGESHPNDYEHGRQLTRAEKAAKQYGEYWTVAQKQRFIANKTDLSRKELGWA